LENLGGRKKKMAKYRVKSFIRKGGVRVKAHTRHTPRLTTAERQRRVNVAQKKLLPAAIKAAGQRGFSATLRKLEKHKDGIKTPKRLSGWLKGQAKKKGLLSPKHPYKGRRKKK